MADIAGKDKVLPEGERAVAEEATEQAQAAPVTREELTAKLEQLSARARAAGMSPLQMMARSYAERGMKVLDGLLSALEEDVTKKQIVEDVSTKKKA
mgnify:CR=1 FL=1